MKKKIVQKIMAAVISIATISSTPGLTSAIKISTTPWAESGKKGRGRKKNPGKIKGKRKNKKTARPPRKSKEERDIEKLKKIFEKLRKKKKKDEKNIQLNQNNITYNENVQNEIEMAEEENASGSENIQNESEMAEQENASGSENIQNESEMAEEEENILTTIEILESCCQDVDARKNVANSIFALTQRGFFKNKSKEEILRAIGMLKLCVEDDSSKTTAAKVINQMAYCGYFVGWTREEVLKIFEVLTKCAEQQAVLKIVWSAVYYIDVNVCFRNWNGEDFKELLNSPSKFSQNLNAIQSISKAILKLISAVNVSNKKPVNVSQKVDDNVGADQDVNMQKNEIVAQKVDDNVGADQDANMQKNKTVSQKVDDNVGVDQHANMQKNETVSQKVDDNVGADQDANMQKNEIVAQKVDDNVDFDENLGKDIDIVKYILEVAKKNKLYAIRKHQIEISERIFKYLENKDPKQQIEIITELAKNKCFECWQKTILMKIFTIIEKYSKNDYLKFEVSKAVLELNKIDFSGVQSKTKNEVCEKLLDILFACDENSCDKSNILSSIADLIGSSLRYYGGSGLTQNYQVKILNLLKEGMGDQNSKKSASHAFAVICDKKVYKSFNTELLEELSKIKDEVFKFIKTTTANSDDFDKKDFVFILKVMIKNNFLNQEEIIQATGILEKCSEDNLAKEDILNAIGYLSNIEGSWRSSREAALKVISILKRYIANEQKPEAVLGLILSLAKSGVLKNQPEEEILKTLDVLERCDLTNEYYAFLTSKIIMHLIDERFFEVFSSEKLPNVKEALFKPNSNHKNMLTYLPQIINTPEMNQYSKQEIVTKTTSLLSICLKQGCSKTQIATVALKLVENYFDKNTAKKQIIDLLEILTQCKECCWARRHIIKAFSILIEGGYLRGLSKQEGLSNLTDTLQFCSLDSKIRNDVFPLVINLAVGGYLEEYSQDDLEKVFSVFKNVSDLDIFKIIQLLKSISKENIERLMDYIKKAKNS